MRTRIDSRGGDAHSNSMHAFVLYHRQVKRRGWAVSRDDKSSHFLKSMRVVLGETMTTGSLSQMKPPIGATTRKVYHYRYLVRRNGEMRMDTCADHAAAPPSIHSERSESASLGNRSDNDHHLNHSSSEISVATEARVNQDDTAGRHCSMSISYEDGSSVEHNRSNDTERILVNIVNAANKAVLKSQQEQQEQLLFQASVQFQASDMTSTPPASAVRSEKLSQKSQPLDLTVVDELAASFASSCDSTNYYEQENLNPLWIDTLLDYVDPLDDDRSAYTCDSTTTASESVACAHSNSSFLSDKHLRSLSSLALLREWWKKELISDVIKDSSNTVNTSYDAEPAPTEQLEPFSNADKLIGDEFQNVLLLDWHEALQQTIEAAQKGDIAYGTAKTLEDCRPQEPASSEQLEPFSNMDKLISDEFQNALWQDWVVALQQTIDAAQKGDIVCGTAETLEDHRPLDLLEALQQTIEAAQKGDMVCGTAETLEDHRLQDLLVALQQTIEAAQKRDMVRGTAETLEDHRPPDWVEALQQTIEAAQTGDMVCRTLETLKESYKTIQKEVNSFDTLGNMVQALKKSKSDKIASERFRVIYEHVLKRSSGSSVVNRTKGANCPEAEITLSDVSDVAVGAQAVPAAIQEATEDISGSNVVVFREASQDISGGKLDRDPCPNGVPDVTAESPPVCLPSLPHCFTVSLSIPGDKVPRIFMPPEKSLIERSMNETLTPICTLSDSSLIAGCQATQVIVADRIRQLVSVLASNITPPTSGADNKIMQVDSVHTSTPLDDSLYFEQRGAAESPFIFDTFDLSKSVSESTPVDAVPSAACEDFATTVTDCEKGARGQNANTRTVAGAILRAERVDANAPDSVVDLGTIITVCDEDFRFPLTPMEASLDQLTSTRATVPDLCLMEESDLVSSKLYQIDVSRMKVDLAEEPDPVPFRVKKRRPPKIHITTLSHQSPETLGCPTAMSQRSPEGLRNPKQKRISEKANSRRQAGRMKPSPACFDSTEADLTQFGVECELALMPDPDTIVPDTSSSLQGKDFAQLPPLPAPGTIVLDPRITGIDDPFQQETDSPSPNRDKYKDRQGFGSTGVRQKPNPHRIVKRIGNAAFTKIRLKQKARSRAGGQEDDRVLQPTAATAAEVLLHEDKDAFSPSARHGVEGRRRRQGESLVAAHAWSIRKSRLQEKKLVQEVHQPTRDRKEAPNARSEQAEVSKRLKKMTVGSRLDDGRPPCQRVLRRSRLSIQLRQWVFRLSLTQIPISTLKGWKRQLALILQPI
jgi:hypothetical protein